VINRSRPLACFFMSKREEAVGALFQLLGQLPLGGNVPKRNSALPERMTEHSMVVLRDGDMNEVDVMLSPLTYQWEHSANLEVYVSHPDGAERDARMDVLLKRFSELVTADRTLGGVVQFTQIHPPKFEEVAPDGALGIKACTLDVVMHYASSDPLS
jgi:hypothetical protein